MTFTMDMVDDRLSRCNLATGGTEQERRERLADYTAAEFDDHVEAWEIRTGRPWDEMTRDEAEVLVARHPETVGNPAVLSKLLGR